MAPGGVMSLDVMLPVDVKFLDVALPDDVILPDGV